MPGGGYPADMLSIHSSSDEAAAAVAEEIATEVAASPQASIGLAGGSTPAAVYGLLARRDIDWAQTTLWLGDERWVPPDHADANTGMIRSTLGAHGAARLLAPDTTLDDPAESAEAYEVALRAAFAAGDPDGRPGTVLLGMGDDGHTASLFPGSKALDERQRYYVANWIDAKETWRLTATFSLLWSARRLLFLVTGEAKASMLARILEGGEPLPAQRAAAGNPAATWYVDAAAASQLRASPS